MPSLDYWLARNILHGWAAFSLDKRSCESGDGEEIGINKHTPTVSKKNVCILAVLFPISESGTLSKDK